VAWLLLKIQANDQTADTISDALMSLGALSASIEDAHADTASEQAIFGEPGDPPPGIWQQSIVPDEDAINIILDPGLAFGTGSHPTTHLCLEWLTQQSALSSVLDYGCGSGILAIVAKKLGADHVVGVDIDDQAVTL